jgi:uncharacterized membrane protein YeaQ/YmgE (transglycosylase-associated protein family)
MTLTVPGLIADYYCGDRSRRQGFAGGARGGLIVSTAVGFIGALSGPDRAAFHLTEPFVLRVNGYSFPIMWSIIGGALFVAFLHLLAGPRGIWS